MNKGLRQSDLIRKLSMSLLFGLIGIIYLWTRNPFPEFGDSLGFLLSAIEGFDLNTNASSHFLYVNFCHISASLLSFLSPVWVVSMVSVFFGLISVLLLYQVLRILEIPIEAALVSTAIYATGFSWWRQVVIIEVYSFHMCLFLVTLKYLMHDWMIDEYRHSWRVSFWLGMAIWAHIQHLLLVPLFIYYLLSRKKDTGISKILPIIPFLIFLIGLIVIPLFTQLHPISAVFFDNRSQGAVLGIEWLNLGKGIIRSIGYALYNFHIFIPFMLHGIWLNWKVNRRLFYLIMLGIVLPYWGFAMRFNVSDNYVFFLAPYVGLIVFCGMSIKYWLKRLSSKNYLMVFWLIPLIISPIIYASSLCIAQQSSQARAFAETKAYKGGLSYYLWPGRSGAPDPLDLAKQIQEGKIENIDDFERQDQALKIYDLMKEN